MFEIVVAEDLALGAGALDALDHRIVIIGVRQDQTVGQQRTDGGDRRQIGNPARGEDETARLAVQIGEFGLQRDERMIGAGDVACAARADAMLGRSRAHRLDHLRIETHAEIIVGAPDDDVLDAPILAVPAGVRKMLGVTLEIDENAIAFLGFETAQSVFKICSIPHQRTQSLCGA